LINAGDGTLAANYEYAAFGEPIRATGVLAKNNPFRFSTKYQDDESDLVYYGQRYFNSSTGISLSKDPIKEAGGLNLYKFARNDLIDGFDFIGLLQFTTGIATLTLDETLLMSPEEITAYYEAQAAEQAAAVARQQALNTAVRVGILAQFLEFCHLRKKCTDDAGAKCSCDQIQEVQLKNDTADRIGHTFLDTPTGGYGFYPAESIPSRQFFNQGHGDTSSVQGEVRNDNGHPYDPNPRTYKVCPDTLAKIYLAIQKGNNYQYNAGNYGNYNCTGFACYALEQGGLTPPNSSSTPGLQPATLSK
jgi:RHS repeat-associated protein